MKEAAFKRLERRVEGRQGRTLKTSAAVMQDGVWRDLEAQHPVIATSNGVLRRRGYPGVAAGVATAASIAKKIYDNRAEIGGWAKSAQEGIGNYLRGGRVIPVEEDAPAPRLRQPITSVVHKGRVPPPVVKAAPRPSEGFMRTGDSPQWRARHPPTATPGKLATQTIANAKAEGRYDTTLSRLDPDGALRMALSVSGSARFAAESDVGLVARSVDGRSNAPQISSTEHGINVRHKFLWGVASIHTGDDAYGTRQFNVPLGCSSSIMAPFRRLSDLFQVMKFNSFRIKYISQASKEWVGVIAIGKGADVLNVPDPADIVSAGGISGTIVRDIKDDFHVDYGASGMLSTGYPKTPDQMPFCCYGSAFSITQGITNSSGSALATGTILGWYEIEVDVDYYAMTLMNTSTNICDQAAILTTDTSLSISEVNTLCQSALALCDTAQHDAVRPTAPRFVLNSTGNIRTTGSGVTAISVPENTQVRMTTNFTIIGTGLAATGTGSSIPLTYSLTNATLTEPVVWMGTNNVAYTPSIPGNGPYYDGNGAFTFTSITYTSSEVQCRISGTYTATGMGPVAVTISGSFLTAMTTVEFVRVCTEVEYVYIPTTTVHLSGNVVKQRPAVAFPVSSSISWPEYTTSVRRAEPTPDKMDPDDEKSADSDFDIPSLTRSTAELAIAIARARK